MAIVIPLALKALREGWSYKIDIIDAVYNYFESFDQADEYLNFMDQYEYDTPRDAWNQWCYDENIEHEINNNPF